MYTDFTTNRADSPDFQSLFKALRNQVDPTAGPIDLGAGHWRIKTNNPLTVGQIKTAQNLLDTVPASTPQLIAQDFIDNMPIFEKALLLTLLDQINVLRTKAGLATVTPAQAIQAVRDKAGTL